MHRFRILLLTLAMLPWLGLPAAAQSLTQITDTVKNADGSPFNGTVVITWTGGTTGSGAVPYSTSTRIYNGVLSVSLVPNSGYSSVYLATYNSSDGRTSWVENWVVGPSSTPLTLNQVRTTLSTTSGSGNSIPMTQVTGLSAYLNALSSSLNSVSSTVSGFNTSIAVVTNSVSSLSDRVNTLQTTISNPASSSAVEGETPVGAIDGTNAAFTIASTPSVASSLMVFRNGILQSAGSDYSFSGKTITFAAGSIPQTADVLQVSYRLGSASQSAGFVDAEIPQGTINGTNLAFSLANTPATGTLRLYKNGALLQAGVDYAINSSAITFSGTASAPVSGDTLSAYYRTSN